MRKVHQRAQFYALINSLLRVSLCVFIYGAGGVRRSWWAVLGWPCSMGCGMSRFDEEVIKTAVRRLNPKVATGEARWHTGRSGCGCGRCGGVRVAHRRGPPLHCRAPTSPLPPRLLPPAALCAAVPSLPAHWTPWRAGAHSLLGAYPQTWSPLC